MLKCSKCGGTHFDLIDTELIEKDNTMLVLYRTLSCQKCNHLFETSQEYKASTIEKINDDNIEKEKIKCWK